MSDKYDFSRYDNYKVSMKIDPNAKPFMHSCPADVSLRFYEKGDERLWAYCQWKCKAFESFDEALKYFEENFATKEADISERMIFAINNTKHIIGTITAWNYDDRQNSDGTVRFWAVLPEYRNRGIGQALLAMCLTVLNEKHKSIIVECVFRNWLAVSLFLKSGFLPRIFNEDDKSVWSALLSSIVGDK